MWLLKKLPDCLPKGAVHASHQYLEYVSVGQFTLSIPSVARCLFQSLPVMNGLVCSSVLGQFEYQFFVRYAFFSKTILFIFGSVGSSCVGFSLVWVSVGHNQWCAGFSLQWLLLLWGTGSRASVVAVCELGVVASRL